MLSELSMEVQDFIDTSKHYFPTALIALGALWVFNCLNWATGAKLNRFGIWPRHWQGLIGILLAPFLHANFTHLLFNSAPLFFLSLFVMSLNLTIFYYATFIIVILAGLGVWLVGRNGIHLGASALIAGYFGFVLGQAYEKPTFTTLFCAVVAFYYFGGILLSFFPTQQTTSWEGHLCGFLAGLSALYLCTHYLAYFPALPW